MTEKSLFVRVEKFHYPLKEIGLVATSEVNFTN